jgi:hypothetical protein
VKTAEQIAAEITGDPVTTSIDWSVYSPNREQVEQMIARAIATDRAQAVVPGGPEQIARAVFDEYVKEAGLRVDPPVLLARAVTAGIDAAWSSWEPESVPHTPEPWTNDDGIEFEPFITRRAAGIWVTDTEGRRECVRLEPSTSHDYNPDNGATADVFLYHGDAAEEDSVTYVNLFEGTGPEDDDE